MSKHSNESKERGSELLSLGEASFGRKTSNAGLSSVRRTALTSERSLLPRSLTALTAALLLTALPALAKPTPKAPVQTAVIENSGSTNTTGYTLRISPSGEAGQVIGNDLMEFKPAALPKAEVKKFFADLNAAMPLTSLPVRHGMRSASFGTETFITYKGQKSPDLTFASDPRTAALKADIDSITKALHIGNAPRRPIVLHLNSANTPGTQK